MQIWKMTGSLNINSVIDLIILIIAVQHIEILENSTCRCRLRWRDQVDLLRMRLPFPQLLLALSYHPQWANLLNQKQNKYIAYVNVTTTFNAVSRIPGIYVCFNNSHFRYSLRSLIIIFYLGHCPDWYLYGRSIWNEVDCQGFVRSILGLRSTTNKK